MDGHTHDPGCVVRLRGRCEGLVELLEHGHGPVGRHFKRDRSDVRDHGTGYPSRESGTRMVGLCGAGAQYPDGKLCPGQPANVWICIHRPIWGHAWKDRGAGGMLLELDPGGEPADPKPESDLRRAADQFAGQREAACESSSSAAM